MEIDARSVMLAVGFVVSGTCAAQVSAQDEVPGHPGLIRAVEDAPPPFKISADDPAAEYMAKEYGITREEAARRLSIQQAYEGSDFKYEFAGRYAGEFITQRPTQQVVVRLTGSEPVAPRAIPTEEGPMPVEFEVGALDSLRQLEDKAERARQVLSQFYPQYRGLHVDVFTGSIDVHFNFERREEFAEFQRREYATIQRLVGAPVTMHGGVETQ
jgi:hypothetical protein